MRRGTLAILASLALGYYLGGRLSEKAPRLSLLCWVVLAAAVTIGVTPFIARPFSRYLVSPDLPLEAAFPLLERGSFLSTHTVATDGLDRIGLTLSILP